MADDSSDGGSSAGGSPAPQFQPRPTSSVADVLADLERQGISDLESLVRKLIAHVRQRVDEEQGEDDSPWERELFIHDHYVMTHTGHTLQ